MAIAKSHSPQFLAVVNDAKSRVREVSLDEHRARVARGERWLLVDVREESEWQAGRVPGAIHLGKGVIERDIEAKIPDPNTPIVLYCGGGFRSALAADVIQRMGYRNVLSLAGGYRAWVDSGEPTERD